MKTKEVAFLSSNLVRFLNNVHENYMRLAS